MTVETTHGPLRPRRIDCEFDGHKFKVTREEWEDAVDRVINDRSDELIQFPSVVKAVEGEFRDSILGHLLDGRRCQFCQERVRPREDTPTCEARECVTAWHVKLIKGSGNSRELMEIRSRVAGLAASYYQEQGEDTGCDLLNNAVAEMIEAEGW